MLDASLDWIQSKNWSSMSRCFIHIGWSSHLVFKFVLVHRRWEECTVQDHGWKFLVSTRLVLAMEKCKCMWFQLSGVPAVSLVSCIHWVSFMKTRSSDVYRKIELLDWWLVWGINSAFSRELDSFRNVWDQLIDRLDSDSHVDIYFLRDHINKHKLKKYELFVDVK
jgi:hypothetical protein